MAQGSAGEHWVGSWATGPMATSGHDVAGRTVRTIARVSVGGSRLRIRVSNIFGRSDLPIAAARLALRRMEARTVDGSDRAVTFAGSTSTVVPAGAVVVSDPVDLDVAPLTDLAVSVHVPSTLPDGFVLTGHDPAHQTNYVSDPGDFTAATDLPVHAAPEAFLLVTGIDVLVPSDVGAVVAFGDSLTEGNLSTLDANHRWPDQLARRISAGETRRRFAVVNQGIGGGRLLHDGIEDGGMRRFDRDVLAQPGATHVVVLLGVNDLRNSQGRAEEVVTAEQLTANLHQLAVRAHDVGITGLVGTILTWEDETFNGRHYTEEAEAVRRAVNGWIRTTADFDGMIDFEAALHDPAHPTRMDPR